MYVCVRKWKESNNGRQENKIKGIEIDSTSFGTLVVKASTRTVLIQCSPHLQSIRCEVIRGWQSSSTC